jgi:hypothetical protein
VTCTATDLHGNAAIPVTFSVTIEREDRTIGVANTFGEIPVTGGDIFDISCTDPAINILQPPGAKVTFIGLCGYQAVLEEVGARALPQSLSQGATFVNGITVTVLQDGNQVDPLPDGTSFLLGLPTPPDSEDKYGILFWDGNKWTELNGQESDDGFFEVSSNQTGFFILVSK